MAGRRELKRDEAARSRREIIRRASLYSVFFFLAGVLVAVLGAALVALLLSFTGLPFLPTWLAISAIVVVVSFGGVMVQSRRKPPRRDGT